MRFTRALHTVLAFALVTPLVFTSAHATLPTPEEVTGTWTGKVDGQEFCQPDGSGGQSGGGAISADVTFDLSATPEGYFTGAGTYSSLDEPGDTGTLSLQGGVDPQSGNIYGEIIVTPSSPDDVAQRGGFEGVIDVESGTMNLSLYLTDESPGTCVAELTGTFTKGETDPSIIDPEETASSVLTAPTILKTQVQAISTSLTARINDVVRGIGGGPRVTANGVYQGISGLAAGEDGPSYGVWASYSYSDFDNDFAATLLDGHRHNVLFGADMTPRDNMVLGIAGGYEFASIDTDFNGGDQDTDGFTVAPYFGLILSDNWNVSASVGYSSLSTDQYRTDPLLGTRIDSDPDSDRWFGTLNLNGYATWDNWLFTGRIGMLHARSDQESFTESDGTAVGKFETELGQWNVGGEAAYSWGDFEPFLRATYERDYSQTRLTLAGTGPQPSNDDDNFLFGLGLRYFSSDNGLSGNIEWYKRLGREDYDEDTFAATIRWDF